MSNNLPLPIPKSGDSDIDNAMMARSLLQQKVDTYKQIYNCSLSVMGQDNAKSFIIALSNIEMEGLNKTLDFLKQNKNLIDTFLSS